jgi:hypothetical protein
MNKKYKRQKQKKQNFPWLILAFGGILIVIAGFFVARQNGSGSGTPSITVDQQRIDYGNVKFGVEKTFAIKITNTGDATLRFKENPYIEVLEGC